MLNSPYKEIIVRLGKVRRRIYIEKFLRNLSIAFAIATILITIVALTSRFMPIYGVYFIWLPSIYLGGLVASLIFTIVFTPKLKRVSEIVDSFGLDQRVSTALEFMDEENIYKKVQAEDALAKLNGLDYVKHIRLIPSRPIVGVLLGAVVIFSLTFLIPDKLKDEANRLHSLKVEKKEEIKKVEDTKKDINENKKLTEQEKKELLAKVDELKKDIKLAKTDKEIDKAKEKLAKKLDMDKNKELDKDLDKLAEGLKKNEATKELANAIKNNDDKKLQSELDKLKNDMKKMDSKQKEALKNSLSSTAASLSSSDLKGSLGELSDSLSSEDEASINKAVSSISNSLAKASSQKSKNKTLASLQKDLGDEQQQLADAQDQNLEGQGNGSGNGSGSGDGSGNSSGGNGAGSGSGSGAGAGAGGSGAGNGTSNGTDTITPYSGGGVGSKAPGASTEKEYEKVFTPKRLGGDGKTSSLSGKSGNNGNSESEITDKSNATLGQLKPYDQVIGEYSKEAMENMDTYEVPDGMTEIIKGYFSSLQQ